MTTPLGQHSLFDYLDCPSERLRDTEAIRRALREAVLAAGGTIVTDAFHTFSPYGVSGVVVISQSHVTIHTWPEHGYAAVDVFSCGVSLDHDCVRERIGRALGAERIETKLFARGSAGMDTRVAPSVAR